MSSSKVKMPKNRGEAEALIAEVGELQRKITAEEGKMKGALATAKGKYETAVKEHAERLNALVGILEQWAEEHRAELLEGDSKTATLATGEIVWRNGAAKVVIEGVEMKEVIAQLKEKSLKKFIARTVSETLDKKKLLANPEAADELDGVNIVQVETITIKPFGNSVKSSAAA